MSRCYQLEKTQGYLEAAAAALRDANPGHAYVIEDGAVWLRHNGFDYGIYSATIMDERIVYIYNEQTRSTPLHQPSPIEVPG